MLFSIWTTDRVLSVATGAAVPRLLKDFLEALHTLDNLRK